MMGFNQAVMAKPAVVTWSPLDLPGLALWLDAADASSFTYSSGVRASQWNDKSGNGRHFTQATTGNQPSRDGTQNGQSTVVFDAARPDFMSASAFAPSTATFAICTVAAPTTTDDRVFFSLGSDNHAAISHRNATNASYGGLLGGVAWIDTSTTGDSSGCSVGILRRSGGTITMRRNAVDLSLTAGNSTPLAASGSMWLGGDNSPNRVSVNIGEIIVMDGSTIAGADLTALESYFNAKWAVY